MASAILDTPQAHGKQLKTVYGTFYPQGTSAPTVNANQTRGVSSITRTAAGTFLITLKHPYLRLVDKQATVQHTTAVDLVPQFGDIANVGSSSAVTLVLRLVAVATATDMAANANNSVSFKLTFSDSGAY